MTHQAHRELTCRESGCLIPRLQIPFLRAGIDLGLSCSCQKARSVFTHRISISSKKKTCRCLRADPPCKHPIEITLQTPRHRSE